MAFLVTFVATDKSNPPEAKQKIEIPLPLNRSLGTFFRERKYPAGGKKKKKKETAEAVSFFWFREKL